MVIMVLLVGMVKNPLLEQRSKLLAGQGLRFSNLKCQKKINKLGFKGFNPFLLVRKMQNKSSPLRRARENASHNGMEKKVYRAIDLFAGIGGIRIGFQHAFVDKIEFVWANDNDKFCVETYKANFEDDVDCRDINEVIKDLSQLPNHDILLAGFPCQPFSMAGRKEGFEDKTRGTLFYAIATILNEKSPPTFFLENVPYFEKHDQGRTWKTVKEVLEKDLDYKVYAKIIKATKFGLPQKRKRFYIVGFKDRSLEFEFPKGNSEKAPVLASFLEKNVDTKYYLSQEYLNGLKKHRERHESKGHGFGYIVLDPQKDIANTLVVGGMGRERNLIKDTPIKNCWKPGDKNLRKKNCEGIRKLTPRECANLQGFPKDFVIPVSNTQAYKQFANAVPVSVIEAIAIQMLKTLSGEIPKGKMTYYSRALTAEE